MHRLFVLECLKRQRNLRSSASARAARSSAPCDAICCSVGAAILLQKTEQRQYLLRPTAANVIYFKWLAGRAATQRHHPYAAPLLQQSLQHNHHEKGALLARGALP
jgi:hypothetical protein